MGLKICHVDLIFCPFQPNPKDCGQLWWSSDVQMLNKTYHNSHPQINNRLHYTRNLNYKQVFGTFKYNRCSYLAINEQPLMCLVNKNLNNKSIIRKGNMQDLYSNSGQENIRY